MNIKKIIASEIATLDSNVYTGGGTDVTANLQAALDEALTCGGVHLVIDGAALVSTLRVHSNTTIECLSYDCGFFQKANSNIGILSNVGDSPYQANLRNVTLIGGTYNQNCAEQEHHVCGDKPTPYPHFANRDRRLVFALEFYGIENLTVRDIHIRDFRTFGFTVGGFQNVYIENVWFEMSGDKYRHAQNQDGFHFWGPGRFLTVKNVGGTVGDDFMNIGPDEADWESSITDVLVDGVFLDDADQGIRLLSRKNGRLDRVTIQNVTGTYRTFGFYINPWFAEGGNYGNFGNITFENIDLRAVGVDYFYHDPFLFSIGGNIECMTFRNITDHNPSDNRTLFELGLPYENLQVEIPADNKPKMGTFIIDGLTITGSGDAAKGAECIRVFEKVDRLVLRHVLASKDNSEKNGHLIAFQKDGAIDELVMHDVIARGFDRMIDQPEKIGNIIAHTVTEE